MTDALVSDLGIPLATFVLCFLSAVIPLIHAELYLITVSVLSPPETLPLLAVLGALGQILGKLILFYGGRGTLRLSARVQRIVDRYHHKMEGAGWALVFVSSFTGFPPFMIISVLAGMFEVRLRTFLVFGFLGRLLRFAIALAFPQLVKDLF
jgi:membrane protein YqaA with SNARE-associated domain